jgi:predicted deacylase
LKKALIKFCILSLIFFSQTLFSVSPERPRRENITYFINTPNQLDVYRLYGRNDGNTALILGGIQGDEPGGFLSADLYPDLVLERGNLIVVPRANFHSIIRNNRGGQRRYEPPL